MNRPIEIGRRLPARGRGLDGRAKGRCGPPAVLLALTAALALMVPTAARAGDWASFRGDAQLSGRAAATCRPTQSRCGASRPKTPSRPPRRSPAARSTPPRSTAGSTPSTSPTAGCCGATRPARRSSPRRWWSATGSTLATSSVGCTPSTPPAARSIWVFDGRGTDQRLAHRRRRLHPGRRLRQPPLLPRPRKRQAALAGRDRRLRQRHRVDLARSGRSSAAATAICAPSGSTTATRPCGSSWAAMSAPAPRSTATWPLSAPSRTRCGRSTWRAARPPGSTATRSARSPSTPRRPSPATGW